MNMQNKWIAKIGSIRCRGFAGPGSVADFPYDYTAFQSIFSSVDICITVSLRESGGVEKLPVQAGCSKMKPMQGAHKKPKSEAYRQIRRTMRFAAQLVQMCVL